MTTGRKVAAAAMLAAAGALAGCGAGAARTPLHALGAIDPERPILVAYGDEIVETRGARADGRVQQRIVYANETRAAGENYQEIVLRHGRSNALLGPLSDEIAPKLRISLEEVQTRMVRDFPGIEMRLSDRMRRGPRGAYVFASSVQGATPTCVLAWETVPRPDIFLPDVAGMKRVWRRCDPRADLEQLLRRFESYRPSAGIAALR